MSTVAPSQSKPKQSEQATEQPNGVPNSASRETVRRPNDIKRTLCFVAGAIACLGITGGLEYANRPAEIAEFGRVGEQFYPEFGDPTLATNLEVFVFDKDSVAAKEFQVTKLDNGRWVIPSHHNYPADAEQQLARTAASVIGIQRGAMVTRWEADHARYGVVNPKQESLNVEEVEGVGSRVILRQSDDSILADYIVGNPVDGSSSEYYVRHPDEDEVYIASLDIDLSTKFTDWIETNLFDVTSSDIVQLTLNDYEFDELEGTVKKNDVTVLDREKSSAPWELTGINADIEEVDKDAVRDTVNAIVGLDINGVRPKHAGLTPELKLDRDIIRSQKDVDRVQADLLTRGFLLQQDQESGDLGLIAREGELSAATDDGLIYRMYFGRAFTGSQEELEIGFADAGADATNGSEPAKSDDEQQSDDEEDTNSTGESTEGDDQSDEEANGKPGRYVFVRVDFDDTLLETLPEKPVEPAKPTELVAADEDAKSKTEDAVGQASPDDSDDLATTEDSTDAKSTDETKTASDDKEDEEEGEEEKDNPLKKIRDEYEAAKKKYDTDLATYERKVKERDEAIEDGQAKAKELNDRFADWYYVIPGAEYDDLKLARADFVTEKEKEEQKDEDKSDDAKSDVKTDSVDSTSEVEETVETDSDAANETSKPLVTEEPTTAIEDPQDTAVESKPDDTTTVESGEPPTDSPKGDDEAGPAESDQDESQTSIDKQQQVRQLIAQWSTSLLGRLGWQ